MASRIRRYAIRVERRAMGVEPISGAARIGAKVAHDAPECGGMIHVNKMSAFMGRDIVENFHRRKNQTPAKRHIAFR